MTIQPALEFAKQYGVKDVEICPPRRMNKATTTILRGEMIELTDGRKVQYLECKRSSKQDGMFVHFLNDDGYLESIGADNVIVEQGRKLT